MPDLRALYPVPFIRALLHLALVSSFIAGVVSVCLRRRKILGMAGISFTLVAALLGGSRVPIDGELQNGPFLGLDWFLLNLIAYSAVFIPLERLFARLPEQDVFRRDWRTDLVYFFLSALLVQVTTLLTMKPAMTLFTWAVSGNVQKLVSSQPLVIQFIEILVLTDFVQYWVHRAFHRVPMLWRFHRIHHDPLHRCDSPSVRRSASHRSRAKPSGLALPVLAHRPATLGHWICVAQRPRGRATSTS